MHLLITSVSLQNDLDRYLSADRPPPHPRPLSGNADFIIQLPAPHTGPGVHEELNRICLIELLNEFSPGPWMNEMQPGKL